MKDDGQKAMEEERRTKSEERRRKSDGGRAKDEEKSDKGKIHTEPRGQNSYADRLFLRFSGAQIPAIPLPLFYLKMARL
ncbi:hypothetical protein CGZ75_17590 [Paenibacillus herberti]|uniref:Uncharacterized protein n=1 Tax=Paenibacillus herberti TaxID=1619309 RepID=A0A229NXU6_9BACL|nr:hypothetical protein CGZ75_17590 [Paenibacillus herberti]